MPDDLTLAVADLKASIDGLRLELVRRDVYESDQRGVDHRFKGVEDDVESINRRMDKADDNRTADRRLLIAAFVSPLLLLVAQLYLQSQGAG